MSATPEPDWYLREWMAHLGKRQADMVKDMGWDKAKANFIYHSKQQYRRDLLNEIVAWLGIRQEELLMNPAEALALRRIRESAAEIVAESGRPFEHAPRKRDGDGD